MVIELAPEHYEICGLVHISNFESIECGKVQNNPILHALWKLLLSTTPHMQSGHHRWFKFVDNNATLIKLHTFFFHFGDMIGVLNGEKVCDLFHSRI